MGQVITLVKIPLTEIEDWIRSKHDLPPILTDFRIEENALILTFGEAESSLRDGDMPLHTGRIRKRRAHRKRNRMKTRGWEVVARITNSKGQKCTIYKPFYDALKNPRLTTEEQKEIVERILKLNKNRPSEASIQYFLDNTLEYLRMEGNNMKIEEPARIRE